MARVSVMSSITPSTRVTRPRASRYGWNMRLNQRMPPEGSRT